MDNYDFPRILEHVKKKDPFLFQFCRFIYYTCMRPNAELPFLRINEIDLRARRLMVPGQNAKSKVTQVIPIDEAFASIMEEINLDQYPRDYYVFGKEYKPGPDPIHDRYFTKLFRKVKDELNLDTAITLYAFKHTRVIHLVEDGEKLHNIIQLTRHKTLAELMDYLKDMGVIIGEAVKLKSRSI